MQYTIFYVVTSTRYALKRTVFGVMVSVSACAATVRWFWFWRGAFVAVRCGGFDGFLPPQHAFSHTTMGRPFCFIFPDSISMDLFCLVKKGRGRGEGVAVGEFKIKRNDL